MTATMKSKNETSPIGQGQIVAAHHDQIEHARQLLATPKTAPWIALHFPGTRGAIVVWSQTDEMPVGAIVSYKSPINCPSCGHWAFSSCGKDWQCDACDRRWKKDGNKPRGGKRAMAGRKPKTLQQVKP
jgi:ribosomal protein L37AE/L43A